MQTNSAVIKDQGILADEVYDNNNFSINHVVENDELQNTYTVLETQDTLLSSSYSNFFGFQALLLKDSNDNYVIAFRGTEGDNWIWNAVSDLASDVSMAGGHVTEQMKLALHFVQRAMEEHGVTADQVTFTGHSLGGSLAETAGYTFGAETYAYNPFGVKWSLITSPVTYNETLFLLGIDSVRTTDNITNIVNVGGNYSDPVTGVGSHLLNSYLGDIEYVKDSNGGNSLGFAPHSMVELNKSIAVYNTLIEMFPTETYQSLTDHLDNIHQMNQQVPRFLSSLGEILDVPQTDDAVAFAAAIQNANSTIGVSLTWLDNNSQASLQSQSTTLEGMYALRELLPFTISSADYSHLNQNGELDADNCPCQTLS